MASPAQAKIVRNAQTDPAGFGSGADRVRWSEVRRIGYVLDSPGAANPLEYLTFQTADSATAWWIDTQGFGRQSSAWRAAERPFGRLEVPSELRETDSIAHETIWPRSEQGQTMYARAITDGPTVVHRDAPETHQPTLLVTEAIDARELEAAPVWVAAEGDDSRWQPWPGQWPVDPSRYRYLLKATFFLRNGAKWSGALELGPAVDRPILFAPDGRRLALGDGDRAAALRSAGLHDILPLDYEPDRGLTRETKLRRLG